MVCEISVQMPVCFSFTSLLITSLFNVRLNGKNYYKSFITRLKMGQENLHLIIPERFEDLFQASGLDIGLKFLDYSCHLPYVGVQHEQFSKLQKLLYTRQNRKIGSMSFFLWDHLRIQRKWIHMVPLPHFLKPLARRKCATTLEETESMANRKHTAISLEVSNSKCLFKARLFTLKSVNSH